ncbi:hypothetical protein EDI_335110 [Entamoeba dispar SAW760]|uniref:Uncharacterized protein n=1 Tax=Entamoeba dispar (strain ATCC PRA-260 / SAW760) TaxID=370354 RepID=B0ESZ2_ENTDS|nr:uncharacterized protein EDI_335110 [Entamoeba dispar SAW760]EDR22355.1 hypothetical protein EDI_335110 [Entamoeba dispar SAW760]|eukprot:EDR22355.1 hypothetical protein EDI_335110 [Entamoeba dispar SAW760]
MNTQNNTMNDDKCPSVRRIIDQLKQNQIEEINLYDNHKKTLLSICEYLIDSGINSDLFEQCLTQQVFMESDIPQSLHNKRSLAFVIQFLECVEPPCCEVENLPKVIANVIQIYCSDSNAEILKTVPSLIGIVGMISVFHMFARSQIQPSDLNRELNILLPAASEQPYVASSRKYCLAATEALLKAPPKDETTDSFKYLSTIPEVQYILSRYPLDRTIDHIKQLLYQYKESSIQSTLRDVFYGYLDGRVVSKPFSWPTTDFISIKEIQTAMNLDSSTFQSIVLGEDQKVKEFLNQQQPDTFETIQNQQLPASTQPLAQQQRQLMQVQPKIKQEKEERSIKKKSLNSKNQEATKPKMEDDEHSKLKKKKRRFSEEETQNLIEGVQQFGIGHWKSILNAYKFDGRSCVDLKDKWRNIENSRNRINKQKVQPQVPQPHSNASMLPPFNSDNF